MSEVVAGTTESFSSKKPAFSTLYGVLLLISSFAVYWIAPNLAKTTFLFGVACGGLCILWGILGFLGRSFVVGAGMTIGVMTFVLLSQVIIAWLGSGKGPDGSNNLMILAKIVMTIMFAGTWGVLVYIMYPDASRSGNVVKTQH